MNDEGRLKAVVRYRFLILLGMLITLLLVASVLVYSGLSEEVTRFAMSAALFGVLLSSGFAVWTQRRQMLIAVSLVSSVFVLQMVALMLENSALEGARLLLNAIVLGYFISILLKYLFTSRRVTYDTIAASLCVYLLIGVAWSIVYSLIMIVFPGSFRYTYATSDPLMAEFAGQRSIFSLYFSFATLSTLGYGDIVPVSNPARMVAVLEAITGQVYLVVLVARLVGMHMTELLKT